MTPHRIVSNMQHLCTKCSEVGAGGQCKIVHTLLSLGSLTEAAQPISIACAQNMKSMVRMLRGSTDADGVVRADEGSASDLVTLVLLQGAGRSDCTPVLRRARSWAGPVRWSTCSVASVNRKVLETDPLLSR